MHEIGREDIDHLQPDKVAPEQLGVDGHIEQRQITSNSSQFEPNTDRPDMFWKKRLLLADDAAVFSGPLDQITIGRVEADMEDPPSHSSPPHHSRHSSGG